MTVEVLEQFEVLLTEYGNTCFDCGRDEDLSSDAYDVLLEKNRVARKAVTDAFLHALEKHK